MLTRRHPEGGRSNDGVRTVGDTDIFTSQVCVSRLTATLLSPMTIAKKEYQLLYSLQLQSRKETVAQ